MAATEDIGAGVRLVQPSYRETRRPTKTERQRYVVGKLVENRRNGTPQTLGAVLLEAGYSPATAIKPTDVTNSKGFQELMEEYMPDNQLAEIHEGLLRSKKLDHMVFPLGPKGEDDINFSGATPDQNQIEAAGVHVERTSLSDVEIHALIADVGGTVRRIVHGETARHVYFWAPNDKARQDALKLAYDLKGRLNKREEPPAAGNTIYNTYIQQNNLDPNRPEGRDIVNSTLEALMEATKRKVVTDEV